jgi:hypothetical protein
LWSGAYPQSSRRQSVEVEVNTLARTSRLAGRTGRTGLPRLAAVLAMGAGAATRPK